MLNTRGATGRCPYVRQPNLRGGGVTVEQRRLRNGGKAGGPDEMRSHRRCGGSPRDAGDSTAIHHARWLSRRKSITAVRPSVRPTLGPTSVWLPGRSLFHSAAPALLASSLFIYMRPRRPLCRWKSTLTVVSSSVATRPSGILLHYSGRAAGRVTNGDRSPPGPPGLTCCRSAARAQSHHLDVLLVG